ncbi:MAG: PilZ domain-containing protein [Candidatus Brocadiia bacterium]
MKRILCEGVLLSFRRRRGFLRKLFGGSSKSAPVPVRNISRDGVCFLSKQELAEGEELHLTMNLGPGRPTMRLEGKVIWCDEGKGKYPWKAGVGFTKVPTEAWTVLENIEDYCKEKKKTSDTWRLHHTDRHNARFGGSLKYPGEDET